MSWKKYAFKSLGLVLVIALLLAAGGLAYVHFAGFPPRAQSWLFGELERSGVSVHCERLWLDFRHGITANDIQFSVRGTVHATGRAEKLVLGVRPTNWFRSKPIVESLELTEGQISVPWLPFDRWGVVEHASARVRLASDGAIDVDTLTARILGIHVTARGYLLPPHKHPVTSTPGVGERDSRPPLGLPRPSVGSPPSAQVAPAVLQSRRWEVWQRILQVAQQIRFEGTPELRVEFGGDLNNPKGGSLRTEFSCGKARYRDWEVDSLAAAVRIEKQLVEVKTLRARLYGGTVQASGRYDLDSGALEARVESSTDVTHFVSLMPKEWQQKIRPATLTSNPRLNLVIRTEPLTPRQPVVKGHLAVNNLVYKGVRTKRIAGDVSLFQNTFRASQVRIEMPDGVILGEYEERLDSRDFTAKCESTTDITQLAPFLGEKQRAFVHLFQFGHQAPHLIGEVQGNWDRPQTLQVSGKVELQNFQFRAIPIDRFVADLKIEKERVILSNALLLRPEGQARGTYKTGLTDRQFEIVGESEIDPHCLKPVLHSNAGRFLDQFAFEKPPRIIGTLSGQWRDIHRLKFDGYIESGPLQINKVAFTGGATQLLHQEDRSRFTDFRLARPEGEIRGEGIYDFGQAQATVKIRSTVNASEVAAVFGAKAVATIQPYRFEEPPILEMHGLMNFREPARNDLAAKITGRKFHYWKFVADEVTTDLIIKENLLALKNFEADFYGGRLLGDARFELGKSPISFSVNAHVAKSNLAGVVGALTGKPVKVEGDLSIKTNLTATTAGIETVEGYGEAKVHHGLLWDVPVFGEVSKAMSAVLPGLGYSRATRAELSFVLSEGKLRTDDLIIDAGMTRITYRGAYAFKNNMDINVQVHLLGATPLGVVGLVFTPLTKLFEFHLGGRLEEPRLRPLYFPKELFFLR